MSESAFSIVNGFINKINKARPTPSEYKVTMIKITSRQLRNCSRSLAGHNISFDDRGVGYVQECFRREIEDQFKFFPGVFQFEETEEVVVPVVEWAVPVDDKEEAEKAALKEIQSLIGKGTASSMPSEEDDSGLTDEQKEFLKVLSGQEVVKRGRGRPPKAK